MTRHPIVFERQAPSPGQITRSLAASEHRVFWLDDAPQGQYDTLSRFYRADLTVIGGGYTGLWTAILAKRRDPGRRVVLLEADSVSGAASGRNGGFAEPSLTHGEENGRNRWPDEYDELELLARENFSGFTRDVDELVPDAQLEHTGVLAVAYEPHQVDWLAEVGSGVFLDEHEVQDKVHSPIFKAGNFSPDAGALVHPARLGRGLARAAAELGVDIFERSRALSIRGGRGGPVQVATDRGIVLSDQVALATNVSRSLLRRSRPLTVPVYDYVLVTEPLSAEQRTSVGWDDRFGIVDLANQFHYSRQTADGRILYGGYDAIYPRWGRTHATYEDRAASYRRLASHFLTTYPQLGDIRFSHRWTGVIDTSTQFCAFHGLARSGRVAYAAGFTGLGVVSSRFAADVMLDRLDGVETARTRPTMVRRKPLPFPPEPLASIGINAARWSLDRADHNEGQRNMFLRALDRFNLGFDS